MIFQSFFRFEIEETMQGKWIYCLHRGRELVGGEETDVLQIIRKD